MPDSVNKLFEYSTIQKISPKSNSGTRLFYVACLPNISSCSDAAFKGFLFISFFNIVLFSCVSRQCPDTSQSFRVTSVTELEEKKEEAPDAPSSLHPLLQSAAPSFIWVVCVWGGCFYTLTIVS